MAKKIGLYAFLRTKIQSKEPLVDIPDAARRLYELAQKEGYKTQVKYIQQFLYSERSRLATQKPPAGGGVTNVIPQQPRTEKTNLEEAIKAIDAVIGMLSTVRKTLVLEERFGTRVRSIILPALKEAGILT